MDALFSSLATQTLTPDLLPSPPPLSLLPLLLQLATTTPPSLLRDRLEEVTLSEPSCSAVKAYMEHCASLRIDLEKKEVALEEELRSAVCEKEEAKEEEEALKDASRQKKRRKTSPDEPLTDSEPTLTDTPDTPDTPDTASPVPPTLSSVITSVSFPAAPPLPLPLLLTCALIFHPLPPSLTTLLRLLLHAPPQPVPLPLPSIFQSLATCLHPTSKNGIGGTTLLTALLPLLPTSPSPSAPLLSFLAPTPATSLIPASTALRHIYPLRNIPCLEIGKLILSLITSPTTPTTHPDLCLTFLTGLAEELNSTEGTGTGPGGTGTGPGGTSTGGTGGYLTAPLSDRSTSSTSLQTALRATLLTLLTHYNTPTVLATSPHIVRTLLDIYVTIITTYGLGSGSSAGSGSLHVDSITIVVKSLADTVKTAPKVDPTQRGLLLDFLLTLLCTVAACYPPIGGGGYNSINSEVVSGVADGIFSVTTMRSIISTHSDVGTAVGVGVAVMATNGALLEEIVHSVITRRVNVSGWGAVVRWLNFSAKKIGYEFEEVFERAEGRRIWFPGASVMQAKYLRRRGLQRLFVEAIEANVSSTSLLSALSPSCSSSSPSPPSSPIDSWSLTDFVDVAEGAVNEIILEWKEHKTLSTPVVWGDAVATAIERWGERSCKYNKAILLQLHYALQYCKKMRGRGGTTVFCVDPAALQLGAIFDEVEEFWPEYAKTFFQLCKDVGRASPTPAAATAKRWEIALLEYEKKQVIASPIPLLQNSRVTPRQISHAILACLWGAVATDSCTLVMNLFRAARAATTEPAAIDCAAVNAIIGQKRDGVNLR